MKTYKAEYSDLSTLSLQAEDSSYAVFDAYAHEKGAKKLENLFEVDESGKITRNIIRYRAEAGTMCGGAP
ncbi:MAG: hypothetical protein HFF69_10305 [Oscillospiraceae bacterium]|jgi:hypothetical protein|nr:hypothetical protein [Oscillospiraceae bacterium]